MAVECQPFLVTAQHYFHGTTCFACQASHNRFKTHKGFCSKSPSHRWADNAHLVVRDMKDASQIRTQIERSLRPCPHFKPLALPASHRSVWFHSGMLGTRRPIGFFDDHIRLFETFFYIHIAVPDAKTMANIRTFLRPHLKVCSIVL